MTVDKYAEVLNAALEKTKAALVALHGGLMFTHEAREIISQVLYGTHDADAQRLDGTFGQAHQTMSEAYQAIATLEPTIRGYLASLGATTTSSPPMSSPGGATAATAKPPPPLSPERVEELRGKLPEPIVPKGRRPPGTPNRKTVGRWVSPDGFENEMASGKDAAHDRAVDHFTSRPSRRVPGRVTDVEMKLAVHMRNNGIKHVSVVINNRPCGGPLSCDTLVPTILPAGYTLTVYGPDGFQKVYHGGQTVEWLP